ncbi:MAG: O-antigen ligase family protein [Aggregatilineales bacterium]
MTQSPPAQPIRAKIARRRLEIIAWMGALLPLVVLGGNITGASWPAHLALTVFGGIAALLVAVTVLESFQQPSLSIHTALDWAWLAVALTTLGSALLGDARRDIEAWVFPFALQLPFFYGIVALRRRGWATENWLRALLIATAAMGVWAVWLTIGASRQSAGLHPPAVFAVSSPFRLYAILDNPNVLGALLAMAIPAALGYAAWTPSLAGRAIVIPWLILVGGVLIATGSRGGQVAALVGSGAAVILIVTPQRIRRWANQRRSRQAMLGALVGIALIGFVGLLVVESGAAGRASSGVRRLALWQTAVTAALANPVLGVGMGSFPVAQLKAQSIPPIGIERHAHNLYLNILAESGVVGFVALALWIGLLGRAVWQKWRMAERSQRALIGGLAGALIAFGVVGLVDDPLAQAAPLSLAVMIAALLIPLPNPSPTTCERGMGGEGNHISASLALLTCIVICLAAAFLTIRYTPLWTAEQISANTLDDWRTASQALDQAAVDDPTDALAQAQAGVAWAHVGTLSSISGDVNDALDRAIASYRITIRLDPVFAIHHLNLGALLVRRGQYAAALPEMARAAAQAPDSAVMHLNYGIGLELAGQTDQAIAEYRRSLAINPRWRDALFWQVTAPRRTAWQTESESSGPASQTAKFWTALQTGDRALQAGNRLDAASDYAQAFASAPDDTARAVAGGMVAYSKGDFSGARYDLESAVTLGGEDATRAHVYIGDLDAIQNDLNGMLAEYALAFQRIDRYGESGPGSAADITYAVNAFGRYGYVADYLPEVTLLDLTPDIATRFITLAQTRASAGDSRSAAYIYRRILESNPGYGPRRKWPGSTGSRRIKLLSLAPTRAVQPKVGAKL